MITNENAPVANSIPLRQPEFTVEEAYMVFPVARLTVKVTEESLVTPDLSLWLSNRGIYAKLVRDVHRGGWLGFYVGPMCIDMDDDLWNEVELAQVGDFIVIEDYKRCKVYTQKQLDSLKVTTLQIP